MWTTRDDNRLLGSISFRIVFKYSPEDSIWAPFFFGALDRPRLLRITIKQMHRGVSTLFHMSSSISHMRKLGRMPSNFRPKSSQVFVLCPGPGALTFTSIIRKGHSDKKLYTLVSLTVVRNSVQTQHTGHLMWRMDYDDETLFLFVRWNYNIHHYCATVHFACMYSCMHSPKK